MLHPFQYGVDGARREAPRPHEAPPLELLDELVAVHRPLVQEPEDKELDPAPLGEGPVPRAVVPSHSVDSPGHISNNVKYNIVKYKPSSKWEIMENEAEEKKGDQ